VKNGEHRARIIQPTNPTNPTKPHQTHQNPLLKKRFSIGESQ
jgi:hypothetical protein